MKSTKVGKLKKSDLALISQMAGYDLEGALDWAFRNGWYEGYNAGLVWATKLYGGEK